MLCLNSLQLKDSSNKVAIVVIVIVLLLLIMVGVFSYQKAANTFFGAARKSATAAIQQSVTGAHDGVHTRKVAEGVYELNHMSKPKDEEENQAKMVYSVA